MQKITTCLWFDYGRAEQAAEFYTSIFDNSKITSISRYGEDQPGPKGSVLTVLFELDGQEFMGLNGGPNFKFSEATSLVVGCKNQKELDRVWDALLQGGGKPSQCGWLTDKFGLSWQVVPHNVADLISEKDQARSERVMAVVMKMVKLDIAEMERAAKGQ